MSNEWYKWKGGKKGRNERTKRDTVGDRKKERDIKLV